MFFSGFIQGRLGGPPAVHPNRRRKILKGTHMDIRKIAAVGGLAVGAALAFSPLASADPLSGVVDTEIASENSTFEFYALLAGDSADVTKATTAGTFDTIAAKDVPFFPTTDTTDVSKVTPLEYELYGVNPIAAGISDTPPIGSDTSFEEFNGATTKFDDAYNVLVYAAEDKNALIPAGDLFGNHITDALAGGTDASAFEYFYNFAIGDLSGFFGVDLSSLDITPALATDLFSLF
jgi:hypothetical protein